MSTMPVNNTIGDQADNQPETTIPVTGAFGKAGSNVNGQPQTVNEPPKPVVAPPPQNNVVQPKPVNPTVQDSTPQMQTTFTPAGKDYSAVGFLPEGAADKPKNPPAPKPVTTITPPPKPTTETVKTDTTKPGATTNPDGTPNYKAMADELMTKIMSGEDEYGNLSKKQLINDFANSASVNKAALEQMIASNPALAGQPAGTALLLASVAGDQTKYFQELTKLDLASIQRLSDMNKLGLEQANIMWAQEKLDNQNAMTIAANSGDYDTYAELAKKEYGIDVDATNLKTVFDNNMKANKLKLDEAQLSIDKAVRDDGIEKQDLADSQILRLSERLFKIMNDPAKADEANQIWSEITRLDPKRFGESSTLDEYKATLNSDATKNLSLKLKDARKEAITDPKIGATLITEALVERWGEEKVLNDGLTLRDSLSDEIKADIAEQAGVDSVMDLDPKDLAGWADIIKTQNPDTIRSVAMEEMTQDLTAMQIDPTTDDSQLWIRAWGAAQSSNNAEALLELNAFNVINGTSPLAYIYADWPITIDADGKYGTDVQMIPEKSGKDSKLNKLQSQFDSMYQKYSTSGGEKSPIDWINSLDIEATIAEGKAVTTGDTPIGSEDKAAIEAAVKQKINRGEDLNPDEAKGAIDSGLFGSPITEKELPFGGAFKTFKDGPGKDVGGYVNIGGEPVKLLETSKVQTGAKSDTFLGAKIPFTSEATYTNLIKVAYGGKEYTISQNGNWRDSDGKIIPSPIKKGGV